MSTPECGAAALTMVLGFYGKLLPLASVRERCPASRCGSTPEQVLQAAESFGLTGQVQKADLPTLKEMKLPVIALWNRKYYVVVKRFRGGSVYLNDPSSGAYAVTEERFMRSYSGTVLVLEPGPDFEPGGRRESLLTLLRRRLRTGSRSMLAIFLLRALSTGADLALLALIRRMVDQVMSGERPGLYGPLLAAMSLVLLAELGFSVLEIIRLCRTSRRLAADSGGSLFKRMLELPMSFYEQHFAGDILDRLEKNTRLDDSLLRTLLPTVVDAASLVFYLGLLLFYDPALAAVCLAVEVAYILISLWYQRRIAIQSRSLSTSSGLVNTSLLNGLGTIETIRSTGSERAFFSLWSASQRDLQAKSAKMLRMNALSSFLGGSRNSISSGCLLFLGAVFMIRGSFTVGMLATFQSALNVVRRSLGDLVGISNDLTGRRTDIERVDDILAREAEPSVPLDDESQARKLSGGVQISHVTFRYNDGDWPAADDMALTVEPGQMVALVGSTGCGKSTLLKLIAGLYRADEGDILYDGMRREQIPDVVFHSSLASVDQEISVFNDTISANLKMWDPTVADYEVILAARDAQIHRRIISAPDGYDSVLYENGGNFSGGELQRLELARALSQEPTLLLLDEFTSALDALTEEKVFQAIRAKGTTCILAAHRFSTVVSCDRIVVMDQGRIVEQGTHEQLYQAGGLYRRLVDMQ